MLKENLKTIEGKPITKGAEVLNFQGTAIKVDVAPEPTAINWNFLHISNDVIKRNTLIAFF